MSKLCYTHTMEYYNTKNKWGTEIHRNMDVSKYVGENHKNTYSIILFI